VCQFAIQKCKDQYIQNYNFVRCFVWAWNLVSLILCGNEPSGSIKCGEFLD
jgi:hypothetical protein